jgi:hypothetical protein
MSNLPTGFTWVQLACFLYARLAYGTSSGSTAPACSSIEELLTGFSPDELAFSDYREQATQLHVTCRAVGGTGSSDLAIVQKVVTEFQRGQVGVGSFQPVDDASYPCSNQNGWGDTLLEVMNINGVSAYDEGAQSIMMQTEPTCLFDSEHAFYNSSVHLRQIVSDELTIDAYMFRNADAQAAANLQHTMTIGSLDACKMELIYTFKPQSGGGLHAEIEIRQHAFGGLEPQVNAAITSVTNTAENKLSIYIPRNKLIEGNGLGPSGCGSTCPSDATGGDGGTTTTTNPSDKCAGGIHHLLDMSLSFTCASTGAIINPTFTFQDNKLTVDLTSAQAPESCGSLYWDPVVTPWDPVSAPIEDIAGNSKAIHPDPPTNDSSMHHPGVIVGAIAIGVALLTSMH